MEEDPTKVLRDIADIVKHAANTGRSVSDRQVGFALFLGHNQGISYVSNGDRGDMVRTLEEWLEKTAGGPNALRNLNDLDEDPPTRVSRLALEDKCAEIGKVIASVGDVGLFLVEMGGPGSLAFFTNMKGFREGIASWVAHEKDKHE